MLLAFFIIPIWWRFRVHSINSRAFGHPPPPIIECRWFLGNVDATGTEPVPTAKTFRFGPFFDYWESEISVLVRNSINQAGDDLVVSDTLVTRDHNNRRQRIIGVECFAGLYDQGFDAFL